MEQVEKLLYFENEGRKRKSYVNIFRNKLYLKSLHTYEEHPVYLKSYHFHFKISNLRII